MRSHFLRKFKHSMFICFEGIAGSGKTTQTKLLADYLENVKKREIFISAVYEGERRRVVSDFMNASGIKLDQNAVMFLFQALHATQYNEVNKALKISKIVIADRWRYSFFAHHLHQGTFDKNKNLMLQLDLLAYRSLEPDIFFLIDIPAKIAYSRYIEREQFIDDNGLDLMNLEYFIVVANYYKKLAHDNGWHIIDGTKDQQTIFRNIKVIVDEKL
ncbi:MAG: dTMP kinase [bacterium]|nr:dTMP kinase [bacterium]